MLGTLYLFTLIGLVVKLVGDLLYVVVDPRVQFSCGAPDDAAPPQRGPIAVAAPAHLAPLPAQRAWRASSDRWLLALVFVMLLASSLFAELLSATTGRWSRATRASCSSRSCSN